MELTPDWLTLGATVLGLGVSVLLHHSSLRVVRAGDLRRARSAALTVLPSMREASRSLTFAVERIQSGEHPDQIGTDEFGKTYGLWTLIRDYKELEKHIANLAQLESAALPCQSAFDSFQKLAEDLDSYIGPNTDTDFPIFEGKRWPASRTMLVEADFSMRSALDALEAEVRRRK